MLQAVRTRIFVVAIFPVVALLALAACGGGSSKTKAAAPTTTTSIDRRGARQAFRQCMTQHGVNYPTTTTQAGAPPSTNQGGGGPRGGGFGGGGGLRQPPPGVDQATFDSAMQACQSMLPQGGYGGANNSAFQAYRSCLADHGVPVPTTTNDPNARGGGRIDRNNPNFAAADAVCRPLLPAQGGGDGNTTTTTARS